MLYQQRESLMKDKTAGVRLDSLSNGDLFQTRATKRVGMVVGGYTGAAIAVEFQDNLTTKNVHAGCLVDYLPDYDNVRPTLV